jgi:hypothetical protein
MLMQRPNAQPKVALGSNVVFVAAPASRFEDRNSSLPERERGRCDMAYVIGVLIPLILQSLLVFIVIEMNTGNGSWVGLGALLIGMFAIPATAIVNFF